jgi:hypothetical protein
MNDIERRCRSPKKRAEVAELLQQQAAQHPAAFSSWLRKLVVKAGGITACSVGTGYREGQFYNWIGGKNTPSIQSYMVLCSFFARELDIDYATICADGLIVYALAIHDKLN